MKKKTNLIFFFIGIFLKIEETINGKFKEWNVQKDTDNKVK